MQERLGLLFVMLSFCNTTCLGTTHTSTLPAPSHPPLHHNTLTLSSSTLPAYHQHYSHYHLLPDLFTSSLIYATPLLPALTLPSSTLAAYSPLHPNIYPTTTTTSCQTCSPPFSLSPLQRPVSLPACPLVFLLHSSYLQRPALILFLPCPCPPCQPLSSPRNHPSHQHLFL